jgi:hypothetical protein
MSKLEITEPTHVDIGVGSARIACDFAAGVYDAAGDNEHPALALELLVAQGIATPVAPVKASKTKES